MAELYLTSAIYRAALRRERVFRDRSNPLEIYNDYQLIQRYRFPRAKLIEIIEMCKVDLQRPTHRNHSLPVHCQVLTALRFFAKATFQIEAGDLENISQPCVSRSISKVSKILCENLKKFIHFPSDLAQLNRIKGTFYRRYKFPNVVGIIDGTLIFIKTPSGEREPLYVSRKGGHAINVQVICDADMRILDVVVKWPGCTNDSFMWKNSGLRAKFKDNPPDGWLLGDSGYSIEPWLLTPFLSPTTPAETHYNDVFKATRFKVENCIGLWKNIFKCIDKSGGILMYSPEMCCKIITAVAVLHNIRRSLRLPEDENFELVEEPEPSPTHSEPDSVLQSRGNAVRRELVQNHFTVS